MKNILLVALSLSMTTSLMCAQPEAKKAKTATGAGGRAVQARRHKTVTKLNGGQLKHTVLGTGEQLLVTKCYSPHCDHCKKIAQEFEQFANKYPQVRFVEIDIVENKAFGENNNIRGVPHFMIFKNGTIIDECTGADMKTLKHKIKTHHNPTKK